MTETKYDKSLSLEEQLYTWEKMNMNITLTPDAIHNLRYELIGSMQELTKGFNNISAIGEALQKAQEATRYIWWCNAGVFIGNLFFFFLNMAL